MIVCTAALFGKSPASCWEGSKANSSKCKEFYSELSLIACWQARIAAVNTALTALGMWALQLPGLGLLSMFVFLCSFIPIAGVAISTAPIGFVALTEYGFFKVRFREPGDC